MDKFHYITANMTLPFVTKKISTIRRCIDVLNSDVYSAISLHIYKKAMLTEFLYAL